MKKAVLTVFLAIIAIAVLLTIFLPMLASTSLGKKILVDRLNETIPGTVTMEDISLSWFGPQTINDAILRDPNGKPVLRVNQLQTDASLFSLLQGKYLSGNMELTDLSLDIKQEANQASNLQIALGRLPVSSILKNNPPLSLLVTDVNARIDQPAPGKLLLGQISGKTLENGKNGSFRSVVHSEGKNDTEEKPNAYTIETDATNFPTSLIDQLAILQDPVKNPVFQAILGPVVDVTIKQNTRRSDSGFSIQAKSQNINLNLTAQIVDNHFSLIEPGQIDLNISPPLFDRILEWTGQSSLFRLEKPLKGFVHVDKLAFPLQRDPLPISQLLLNAQIKIPSMEFRPWFEKWSFSQSLGLENIVLDVKTTPESPVFAVKSQGSFKRNDQSLPFSFDSSVPKPKKMDEFLRTLQEHLKFTFSLRQVPTSQLEELIGGTLPLKRTLGTSADISIEASAARDQNYELRLLVESDKLKAPLTFTINNDLQFNALETLYAAGTLEISSLLIKSSAQTLSVSIPWAIDGAKNRVQVHFTAKTDNDAGEVKGSMLVSGWRKEKQLQSAWNADIHITSDKFSVQALTALVDQPHLSSLLGKTLGMQLSAKLSPGQKQKGFCSITMNTPHLSGNTTLAWNETVITGAYGSPLKAKMTMTPEGFASLRKSMILDPNLAASLELVKPIELSINSPSIPFSLFSAEKPNQNFEANATIDSFDLKDNLAKQTIRTQNVTLRTWREHLHDAVAFTFSSQHSDTANLEGKLQIEGTFQPIRANKLSYESIVLKLTADKIPAGLFCNAFAFQPLLGQRFDLIAGNHLSGKINLNIQPNNSLINTTLQSPRATLRFGARVNNGMAYLSEPLYAEMEASQSNRQALQAYASLFGEIVSSDDKIKLVIDPQGFFIQLHPLTKQSWHIEKASLSLGKMYFLGEGKIAKAMEALNPPRESQVSVWFTPIYFSYNSGMLSLARFDMLVMGLYPLAAWGNIDLLNDRVNMTVGVTGDAIQRAFKIPSIENDYMLQLPLRGTIARAKIDKTKFTAKLAALFASVAAGPEGMLIGAMAGLATSLTEEPTPPPTTMPLPWAAGQEEQRAMSQSEPSTQDILPRERSPLKKIEKKADNFFRNLLKT